MTKVGRRLAIFSVPKIIAPLFSEVRHQPRSGPGVPIIDAVLQGIG